MREILIPAARRLKTNSRLYLSYEIPPFIRDYYWYLVQQHEEKGIHFEKLKISKPFKARTTGEKSQNHHINGHIQQLSVQTGMDFDILKYYFKRKAIGRGYPFDTDPDGEPIPWSETRIDITQAGYLIDTIHQFADENGYWLKEDDFGIM